MYGDFDIMFRRRKVSLGSAFTSRHHPRSKQMNSELKISLLTWFFTCLIVYRLTFFLGQTKLSGRHEIFRRLFYLANFVPYSFVVIQLPCLFTSPNDFHSPFYSSCFGLSYSFVIICSRSVLLSRRPLAALGHNDKTKRTKRDRYECMKTSYMWSTYD